MEATASASDFPRERTRTRKLGAKIKKAARAAATRTRNGAKATGSFCMSTVKKLARGTKRAAVRTGVTLARGVGLLGVGIGLVLKTALNIVGAVLFVVGGLLTLLATAVAGLLLTLVYGTYNLYDTYVHSTFQWMRREDRRLSLGEFRYARDLTRKSKVNRWSAKISDLWHTEEEENGDIVVPTEAVNDGPVKESWIDEQRRIAREEMEAARERAETSLWRRHQEAIDRYVKDVPPNADDWPGAETLTGMIYVDGPEGEVLVDAIETMESAPGFDTDILANVGHDEHPLDHDFTQYQDLDSLLQVFDWYADTGETIEIRSIFKGRHAMLKCYMEHKDTGKWNDLYGRYFSLLFAKTKHQQDLYSMKFVKDGFYRQYEEIKTRVAV